MKINIRNIGESQVIDSFETDNISKISLKLRELNRGSARFSIVDDNTIDITIANSSYCWGAVLAAEY